MALPDDLPLVNIFFDLADDEVLINYKSHIQDHSASTPTRIPKFDIKNNKEEMLKCLEKYNLADKIKYIVG